MRSVAVTLIRFSDWILGAKELLVKQALDKWVGQGQWWSGGHGWDVQVLQRNGPWPGPAHSSAQMTGLGLNLLSH